MKWTKERRERKAKSQRKLWANPTPEMVDGQRRRNLKQWTPARRRKQATYARATVESRDAEKNKRQLAKALEKRWSNPKAHRDFSKVAGRIAFKHGRSRTVEYRIWVAMIGRCHNPDHQSYDSYGGRGIVVCEAWRSDFMAFFKAVGKRPGRGYSIHRRDNDGNYEPGNCKWATRKEQANARRKPKRHFVKSKSKKPFWRGKREDH